MSTIPPFADPPENAPEGEDFYTPPEELPLGQPGDPIYQRKLDNPTAKLTHGRNWLVLYLSQDAHDNPIAVSGIIVLPDQPPRAGGYPLVSWAHGTVGVAHKYAPSRDFEDSDTHPMNAYPQPLLNGFLDRGWAVAMTDYEGLGVTVGRHPYLLGKSEANGVLDIVHTAHRLFPGQISDRYAIAGHSQGGQAALFAARYAPERTEGLVGVAAIAPANHALDLIKASAKGLGPSEGYAFTPLFLAGAIGGDDRIEPAEVLSPEALELWPEVDDKSRAGLSKGDWGTKIWGNQQFKRNGALPSYPSDPNPAQILFSAQLDDMNPDLPIDAPIRISQSDADERVRAATVDVLGIRIRGTNVLVHDELMFTNQGSEHELIYKLYPKTGDDKVVVPNPDPGGLGVHFATINHDRPALTTWLSGFFDHTE